MHKTVVITNTTDVVDELTINKDILYGLWRNRARRLFALEVADTRDVPKRDGLNIIDMYVLCDMITL